MSPSGAKNLASSRLQRSRLRTPDDALEGIAGEEDEVRRVSYTTYGVATTMVARRAFAEDDGTSTTVAARNETSSAKPDGGSGAGVTMTDLVEQCKILAPGKTNELEDILEAFNAYELPKRQFNNKLREIMGMEPLRQALAAVVPEKLLSEDEKLRASITRKPSGEL